MSSRTLLRDIAAGHTVRRAGLLLVLLVLALIVIGLVLLSPLALAAINPNGDTDWQRLADIAGTYAAVSAILALLALGGVAASLILQAREMRATRLQAVRMGHTELLQMAMSDSKYLQVLGPSRFADDAQRQQHLFANLLISHWEMSYEMGDMTEIRLRVVAAPFFANEPGQRFWRLARDARMKTTEKRARRFVEILDEEYQKATRPPPASEATAPEPDTPVDPGGHDAPSRFTPDHETSGGEAPDQESPGSVS